MKTPVKTILTLLTATCVLSAELVHSKESAPATPELTASAQQFFLYGCIHEYMTNNALPLFDGSLAYVVENSALVPDELDLLMAAAKRFAITIPKPDFTDMEHGKAPVFFICETESHKYTDR